MKNIIIKSIFTLLLIIEFYPIESNSQTVNEIKDGYIYNSSNEEQVYGYSEEPEFLEAEDLNIENSISENVNEDINDEVETSENENDDIDEDDISVDVNEDVYDENEISDELSGDADIENHPSRFEGSFPLEYFSQSGKNSFKQLLNLTLLKY